MKLLPPDLKPVSDITRVYYPPEANAPFGEHNFMRMDHQQTPQTTYFNSVNQVAASIARAGWLESDWLRDAIGEHNLAVIKENPALFPYPDRVRDEAITCMTLARDHSGWFAVRPRSIAEIGVFGKNRKGLQRRSGLYPEQLTGFATAKYDVSGTAFERYLKQTRHPEKVYAKISDINVRWSHQSRRIGSTLLYWSLGDFPPDKKPTIYVPSNNARLIQSLGKLSYRFTGSGMREDLVTGSSISESRLQAESVETVRGEIEKLAPWITQFEPIP